MKHFTLSELTVTTTGLPNTPNQAQKNCLIELVEMVLDPARLLLNLPIKVNSAFRSQQVNEKVGGAHNSQHLTGQAADITCEDNARLFNIIRDNLPFDQLIWEQGNKESPKWVHVSYSNIHNRKQILYL